MEARFSGATNATLTINNAQTNDDGNYWVIVYKSGSGDQFQCGSDGGVFPDNYRAADEPDRGAGIHGDFCGYRRRKAPLSYHWQLNGANLVAGGRISAVTNTILTITNAQTGDDGGYTVIVTNSRWVGHQFATRGPDGADGATFRGHHGRHQWRFHIERCWRHQQRQLCCADLDQPGDAAGFVDAGGDQSIRQPGPVYFHQHAVHQHVPTVLHLANAIAMICRTGVGTRQFSVGVRWKFCFPIPMKNILRFIFPAVLLMTFLSGSALAQQKIATVDMRKLFDGYWKTKQAETALNDRKAELDKEDRGFLDNLQKDRDDYQKLLDSANDQAISADERDKRKQAAADKYTEIQNSQTAIVQFERQAQATLAAQTQRMRSDIIQEITTVVTAKAKAAGYTMVMDVAAQSPQPDPVPAVH